MISNKWKLVMLAVASVALVAVVGHQLLAYYVHPLLDEPHHSELRKGCEMFKISLEKCDCLEYTLATAVRDGKDLDTDLEIVREAASSCQAIPQVSK